MKRAFIKCINFYQRFLSFDSGLPSYLFKRKICCYYPTCSQYTKEAIREFGVLKGVFIGIKRVLRCHPWSKGGYDPLKK